MGCSIISLFQSTTFFANRPGMEQFTDQAALFCEGKFKDVCFYPDDVQQHAEKTYHPEKL